MLQSSSPKNPNEKLIWIDLEMSGLDVDKEVVIEAAVIVADYHFKIHDEYETVIKQPQSYLDNMDDWNKKHHGESGLLGRIPHGKTPAQVEDDLIKLVKRHWPGDLPKGQRPVLAGNSIMQDRLFINKYFPKFAALLHYRMLDVTSWKIVLNTKYGVRYEKKNQHRALDDIKESIAELRHYLSFLKMEGPSSGRN